MLSAPGYTLPAPLHIHTASGRFYSGARSEPYDSTISQGSAAWPANNRAIYVPMLIDVPFVLARFFVFNGSNATGNADIGIYNGDTLARLASKGSTARTGTSTLDFYAMTDQAFGPGFYYFGLVLSSTTGSVNRYAHNSLSLCRITGVVQEDLGATMLPDPMTPVASAQAMVPVFGVSQSDTL